MVLGLSPSTVVNTRNPVSWGMVADFLYPRVTEPALRPDSPAHAHTSAVSTSHRLF